MDLLAAAAKQLGFADAGDLIDVAELFQKLNVHGITSHILWWKGRAVPALPAVSVIIPQQ